MRRNPRREIHLTANGYESAYRLGIKGADYVPPKARDPKEIARRRMLPKGTIILEQQRDGAEIVARCLELLTGKDDDGVLAKMIARAANGTADICAARPGGKSGKTMYKRIALPENDIDPSGLDEESLRLRALGLIKAAVEPGRYIVKSHVGNHCSTPAFSEQFGKLVGQTSLVLASAEDNKTLQMVAGDPIAVQHYTWLACEAMIEEARLFHRLPSVGVHPTFAQFAHRDSPLNVWIRNNAPNDSAEVLDQAFCEIMAA